ncbi:DUF998 domain-containing protein [Agromyces mediolanus]|uniref:DUF998 domain-containing protein n=1 Tax=Agromyces mediolanus TaxID=41986 RepID=UPI0038397B2F
MTVRTTTTVPEATATRGAGGLRALLLGSALAGPLFYAASLVQALLRDGYELGRHPLSQLAVGEGGWVQVLAFVIAGLGGLGLALGLSRVGEGRVSRRLASGFVAVFGLGFIVAGLFPMDAQHGFPAGAPEGAVPLSWHATVHVAAAAIAFLALAGACIVLLVQSIRRRRVWASIGHAATALVLLLPMSPTESSVQIALTGAIAFTWVTVLALRLRARA